LIVYSGAAKLEWLAKDNGDKAAMAKKGKYVYDWPRPMVAADIAVFSFFACLPASRRGRGSAKPRADKAKWRKPSWRLLLINRKREPFKGKWALPGGFVDVDEELDDAAARELKEETGLAGVRLEQIHTAGKVGRDPRGRVITVVFMGIITKGQNRLKAGDDAAEAKWFDIEKLPKDLAFDHNEVTRLAIRKLKRKRIYRVNVSCRSVKRR
jgi:8-oxo-dGTP diphosphatase